MYRGLRQAYSVFSIENDRNLILGRTLSNNSRKAEFHTVPRVDQWMYEAIQESTEHLRLFPELILRCKVEGRGEDRLFEDLSNTVLLQLAHKVLEVAIVEAVERISNVKRTTRLARLTFHRLSDR